MGPGSQSCTVSIANRQRRVAINTARLLAFAQEAMIECARLRKAGNSLRLVDELSVVLVSDRRMTELHKRFMGMPGPTDVITFQHGEIVVSVDTARREARLHGMSFEREVRLYVVHGLLHLAGFDDRSPAGAARMARLQEQVLANLEASLPKSGRGSSRVTR